MKATISLDSLLSFIHSLSLEARQEKEEQSYNDFINSMCGAWKDDSRTTEEIADEIRRARQFNVTRHIKPLVDEPE